MNTNKLFLLSENKEDIFSHPKEDLLCLFSKSNDSIQELNEEEIKDKNFLYSQYLTMENYTVPAPMFIADSANSSLDVAHHLIQKNIFPPFASILCRNQKAGRGQLRRNWSSPEGNIYAALCLPNVYPFSTEAAAPALGGIVAHALNQMGYNVFLKWPNDIIQKQADNKWHKVAGILLEERHNTLIAGIGINISTAPPKSELREDYFIEAGTLQAHKKNIQSNLMSNNVSTFLHQDSPPLKDNIKNLTLENTIDCDEKHKNINDSNGIDANYIPIWGLWITLVEHIFLWYKEQELRIHDTPWQNITQQYIAFTGETVRIYNPIIKESSYCKEVNRGFIIGKVNGINSNGELLLQTTNGLITILGGTFSQENNE